MGKTVEQGATTSVWLASAGYKENDSDARTKAQYYDDRKPKPLGDFAKNADAAKRLWEESETFAGLEFDLVPVEKAESVVVAVEEDIDGDIVIVEDVIDEDLKDDSEPSPEEGGEDEEDKDEE